MRRSPKSLGDPNPLLLFNCCDPCGRQFPGEIRVLISANAGVTAALLCACCGERHRNMLRILAAPLAAQPLLPHLGASPGALSERSETGVSFPCRLLIWSRRRSRTGPRQSRVSCDRAVPVIRVTRARKQTEAGTVTVTVPTSMRSAIGTAGCCVRLAEEKDSEGACPAPL